MTPNAPTNTRIAGVEALVHATCLGLSSGFYVWILGDPQPAGHAILKLTQPNLLAGLPKALLVSLVGAIVAAKMLGVSEAMRTWRGRLALGLCPLYMATTSAAIGHLAVMCAPATALLWILALGIRGDEPRSNGALITLHVGMLGVALAFFHQWAWYRPGWEPFVDGFGALRTLLLGG